MSTTTEKVTESSALPPVANFVIFVYFSMMMVIVTIVSPLTWWYDYSNLSLTVRILTTHASSFLVLLGGINLVSGYRARSLNCILIALGVFFAARCIIGF